MKYIKRPDSIRIGTGTAGISFSFEEFVRYLVNNDARFNAGGPGIRAGMRVEEALDKARSDVIELKPDLWELLRAAAEQPTNVRGEPIGYPALVDEQGRPRLSLARQCLVFIDAIGVATDDPPKTPEADATEPASAN